MLKSCFHANICNFCKTPAWKKKLKRCSKCRIPAYCCIEHQKADWKKHKTLCHAFMKAKKEVTVPEGYGRSRLRGVYILMCGKLIGRKLEPSESIMFHMYRSCGKCDDMLNLTDCEVCWSYSLCSKCMETSAMAEHDCEELKLNLDLQLYLWQSSAIPLFKIRPDINSDFDNMDTFITKNIEDEFKWSDVTRCLISEDFTRPLSVYYILSHLQMKLNGRTVLHIAGSDVHEVATHKNWILLSHLIPEASFEVNFIGPELPEESSSQVGEKILLQFLPGLYHNIARCIDAPVAIFAFNCGVHEYAGSGVDKWEMSLPAMLSGRVPIALTSYTIAESKMDGARFRELDPNLSVELLKNPFRGLSPLRDVDGIGVYHTNGAISIISTSSGNREDGGNSSGAPLMGVDH